MKHIDNMLLLNKMAIEREKMGYDVINGTIGMFYLDNGKLPTNKLIRETLSRHINDEDFIYSSIPGEEKYRTLLLKWFFDDEFDDLIEANELKNIATVGGTGAISIATTVENKLNKNNIYYFPTPGWPNYCGVANTQQIEYIAYPLFKNGKFALNDLLNSIKTNLNKNRYITLVINDPCHNPTGYNLKAEEWDEILKLIKDNEKRISIILDCAYIDFAEKKNRDLLVNFAKNAMKYAHVYISLSCSKTFSFYGLRLGELILLYHKQDELAEMQEEAVKTARCFWSNTSHMGMNAVGEILSNEETRDELRTEINNAKEIVNKRKEIFIKEANEVDLEYLPYEKGFFISLPVNDAYELSEKLIEKEIYLAPVGENILRVALCSISTNKLYGLANKIKEEIDGKK